jgi:hypothetical protein
MGDDDDLTRIRLEVAQASLEGDISAFQIAYLKLEGTMMRIAREVWETRPLPNPGRPLRASRKESRKVSASYKV